MTIISIFGGSGFIGSELVSELAKAKFKIRIFTKNKLRAKHLEIFPNLELIEYNSSTNLLKFLKGTDVVINCVGILHESNTDRFMDIHSLWIKKLIKMMNELSIKRFIHISAMGASENAPSKYLKSKYQGEINIQQNLKLTHWTIFKPSVVFGENDKFINLFKKMIKWLPIIFVVSPKSKFQPIAVNDLTLIIINSINDKKTYQNIYNIGGPTIYSFINILKLISVSINKTRLFIPLSKIISYMMVSLLEISPIKLITRDNLRSMEIDNVTEINDSYKFKSRLTELKTYLDKLK